MAGIFSQIVRDSLDGAKDKIEDVKEKVNQSTVVRGVTAGVGMIKESPTIARETYEKASESVKKTAQSVKDAGQTVKDGVEATMNRSVRENMSIAGEKIGDTARSSIPKGYNISGRLRASRLAREYESQTRSEEEISFEQSLEKQREQIRKAKEMVSKMAAESDSEFVIAQGAVMNAQEEYIDEYIPNVDSDSDDDVRRVADAIADAEDINPQDAIPFTEEIKGARLLNENRDPEKGVVRKEWELPSGMVYYEGELGRFVYDPSQFKIGAYTSLPDEYGNMPGDSMIPFLQYIGTETDGSKIHVPEGLNSMAFMFAGSKVESVSHIPSSVTNMDGCYMNCDKLKYANDLVIPESVESANFSFAGCREMKKGPIVIPGNVKACNFMFQGCRSLTKPASLRKGIEECDGMYHACENLEKEIKLPSSAKTWNDMTTGCTKLDEKRLQKLEEENKKEKGKIDKQIAKERQKLERKLDKNFEKSYNKKTVFSALYAMGQFHNMRRSGYGFIRSMAGSMAMSSMYPHTLKGYLATTMLGGRYGSMYMWQENQRRNELMKSHIEEKKKQLANFDKMHEDIGTIGSKLDRKAYLLGLEANSSKNLMRLGKAKSGGRLEKCMTAITCTNVDGITETLDRHLNAKKNSLRKRAEKSGGTYSSESVVLSKNDKYKYSSTMIAKLSSIAAFNKGAEVSLSVNKGKMSAKEHSNLTEGLKKKREKELFNFFYNVEKQRDVFDLYTPNGIKKLEKMAKNIDGAEDAWKKAKTQYKLEQMQAKKAENQKSLGGQHSEEKPSPLLIGEKKTSPVLYTGMQLRKQDISFDTEYDWEKKASRIKGVTIKLRGGFNSLDGQVKRMTISGSPDDLRVVATDDGKSYTVLVNNEASYHVTGVDGRDMKHASFNDLTIGGDALVEYLKGQALGGRLFEAYRVKDKLRDSYMTVPEFSVPNFVMPNEQSAVKPEKDVRQDGEIIVEDKKESASKSANGADVADAREQTKVDDANRDSNIHKNRVRQAMNLLPDTNSVEEMAMERD